MLMETGNPANITEAAISQIKAGLAKDPQTISGYEYLARAYSRPSGDESHGHWPPLPKQPFSGG